MFRGMTPLERGEEMWNRARAMNVAEAVEMYGGTHEAAEAALAVLQEDDDWEYEGDAAHDIRTFVEHEMDGKAMETWPPRAIGRDLA